MTSPAPTFRILRVTDSVNSCDCCGKSDLQKTVEIENLETGAIGHFGTTCALQPSKCFGFSKSEMNFALSTFKAQQQAHWSRARRLYKDLGGKRVDIVPGDYRQGSRPVDLELYERCLSETKIK